MHRVGGRSGGRGGGEEDEDRLGGRIAGQSAPTAAYDDAGRGFRQLVLGSSVRARVCVRRGDGGERTVASTQCFGNGEDASEELSTAPWVAEHVSGQSLSRSEPGRRVPARQYRQQSGKKQRTHCRHRPGTGPVPRGGGDYASCRRLLRVVLDELHRGEP